MSITPLSRWLRATPVATSAATAVASLALLGAATVATSPAFAALQSVTVQGGALQGISTPGSGVSAFLGVPFAAPPVGELRWRAPQPVAAWTGVRSADRFAASCMQPELTGTGPWTREFYAKPPYSEDCLYLNVWTGAKAGADRLPVAVWIHGGGFDQGGANEAIYYGHEMARQKIVFVSINYRMGVFGFYAHPELSRESGRGSGNYGFQDQLAALRWVRDNIAQFGGDPSNVTVVGQSAGATSIEVLLASEGARGLFRRAIAESGFQKGRAWPKLADHERLGTRYAEGKGADTIAKMRALPASELVQLRNSPIRFLPIVDGDVLKGDPESVIASGRFNDVPLITGWNAAEGAVPFDRRTTCDDWRKLVHDQYAAQSPDVLRLYADGAGGDCTQAAQASGHDRIVMLAHAWNANRSRAASAPLYAYEFAHVLPGPSATNWGAFHSAEIVYALRTMDGLDRPFAAADAQVSDRVSGYWINFIRTGDPNGAGLPAWRPFEPGSNLVMQLGLEPKMREIVPADRFAAYSRLMSPGGTGVARRD